MNILVTGANGQLGTEMRNISTGAPDRYIFTDVTSLPGVDTVYLDITNRDAVRLICDSEQVDVIVNCAAYTNVDKAEDDVQMADLLNGATKFQGEQAVQESGCSWQIFRTAWLYSPYGKNFVKTMRQLTAERPTLKVVFDQVGTPTYARDLAELICGVISGRRMDQEGIYHFSDEGVCSWFDFACAIRDLSGNTCDIKPCHSDEFPSKVRRPHFSVLDKTKVKETFGTEVPHWYESLKKCIDRL